MMEINICPICKSEKLTLEVEAKDYFFTKENFNIVKCDNCGFHITSPRPTEEKISDYYKSEEYLSHSNRKKTFIDSIYHYIRNKAVKQKFKMISTYKQNASLLDIGCGTGDVLKYFSAQNWSVKGIEPDADARKIAVEDNKVDVEPLERLTELEKKSFDVVSMWHVLEHVTDINQRIKDIDSLLKDDGVLIIAVPNLSSYDAEKYGKYWAAYDLPRHLYHFTQKNISELLQNNNFELTEAKPMKYDAFYVSMLSEKYINGKSKNIAAFFSGLKSNRMAKKQNRGYSSMIYICKKK